MLKDFMNINYGLELMDDTRFVVDKYSGILVFGAYQAQSLDLKYYLYDLIQNEIDSSFKVKIELHEPLCYRNKAKHILDAGLTSFEGTRDFAIVSPTKTFFYNSHYTHAELSLDGNFIMLCDTSSTVRIFEAGRKKALFEKKLDKMEHINLGAADESSFWLSFSYWDKEERGYFFKSILLEYKEGKYIEQVFPKTSILDIASKNNMFAVLFDNITSRMVFISEDKKLIFSGSELPESLSLNDETDRLMLNFNNGTIRIYDTQTMTLQGTMVHPDSRRHIILTPNGFFSANTDVTPYLYAENNGKIISFESIETLYNKPAEALSVFGQPDIYYTEMLQKTSDIRLKKNSYTSIYKGSHDSAPIIKKILYDGFENTSVSSKKELALNIEFTDSLKGTIHLEIKINGSIVLEKDVTAHTDSFSRIINCEVALVSGENILSVWLTNARGIQSEASEHFILCTADDYTADLYLLAIGVSDYQDNAFNLTFAEKDAMDLSLLYGDTSSVPDVHTFKHKFFGERFTVNIFNKPKRDEEIRYLTEQYGENHFFSNIHQLDYSGYYWIENTDSLYFLWDFKNKNRKRIILPEFNYSSWSLEPLYIPSATDDGFFFKNETGEWFKYIFSENKTVKTNFTKNLKFFYLYDESWITDTIVYDNSAYNSWVSFYDKNGALKKQVTVEFEGLISPELLATSKDGSLLLFAIYNELWLVDVRENNIKKTKIENISHEMYNNTYFFDKNNESLTCLQKIYEEEGSSYNFYTYDMAKAKLKKEYFKYAFNTYNGINNIDGILKWIDISPPVGKKKDFYFKDYITEYSTLKPVSFKNVHIKTLTNEKANKENIIRELNSFYSTAAPNDQIILFLAGHGVLDTNLNFCFAPYDMDFKNPHKYGLEYSAIISYLKKIKAVRKLLIMDSCHSGDIFEKEDKQLAVNQTSDKDKRGVTALSYDNSYEEKVSEIMAQLFDNTSSQNGITVFSASAGTDVAYESKILSNGAFTTAFIANIENVFKDFLGNIDTKKQQPLSLTDNFIYELQKTVISSTQNKQLPNVREFNKLSGIRLW